MLDGKWMEWVKETNLYLVPAQLHSEVGDDSDANSSMARSFPLVESGILAGQAIV